MKNIINFFLTICVAVFFSAHANAKTKVSLWSESAADPAFSALNKIVADFNASQDVIEVEHTAYENTPYETRLKTAFSGGQCLGQTKKRRRQKIQKNKKIEFNQE